MNDNSSQVITPPTSEQSPSPELNVRGIRGQVFQNLPDMKGYDVEAQKELFGRFNALDDEKQKEALRLLHEQGSLTPGLQKQLEVIGDIPQSGDSPPGPEKGWKDTIRELPWYIKEPIAIGTETLGGIGGAAAGAFAGTGVAPGPGTVVGGAVGGMAGVEGATRLNRAIGLREGDPLSMTWGDAARMGTNLFLPAVAKAALKPAAGAVIRSAADDAATAAHRAALETIKKNSIEKAMKEMPPNIIGKAAEREAAIANAEIIYQNGLKALEQQPERGSEIVQTFAKVIGAGKNASIPAVIGTAAGYTTGNPIVGLVVGGGIASLPPLVVRGLQAMHPAIVQKIATGTALNAAEQGILTSLINEGTSRTPILDEIYKNQTPIIQRAK